MYMGSRLSGLFGGLCGGGGGRDMWGVGGLRDMQGPGSMRV